MNRVKKERERMLANFNANTRNFKYENYKLVPNRGDCIQALRIKQTNLEKPYVYERRLEVLKCEWLIK